MTEAQALALIDRYQTLTEGFGYPNTQALQEVERIVFQLRSITADSYYLEKLGKMERHAGIGFSTRKFASYAGGSEQVRVSALGQSKTARDLIREHFARTGKTNP